MQRFYPFVFIVLLLVGSARIATGAAEDESQSERSVENSFCDCRAVQAQLTAQEQRFAGELRQIKRELAMVNQNLREPGLQDIMAGIGYILGLCGIAFFVAGRKQNKNSGER